MNKASGRNRELVLGYLESVSSKVFSQYPKEITALVTRRHGVYALYKGNRLYYVGLAGNLKSRVKHHLQDKHKGKWDKFSLYLVRKSDHIKELEALILRIADPKGNAVKGRLPRAENLSAKLRSQMRKAHEDALTEMLGGKRKTGGAASRRRRAVGSPALAAFAEKRFTIKRVYKGKTYTASVRADGTINYNGNVYNSPSLAGKAVIGRSCNGWSFWRYQNSDGDWVRLDRLRK